MLIQKSVRVISDYWLKNCIVVSQLLCSVTAFADNSDPVIGNNDLGSVATKLNGEVMNVKTLLITGAQAVGVGMALSGMVLWKRISQEKSQKTHGQAAAIIVIGALCFFLPIVMGAGASTFFTNS